MKSNIAVIEVHFGNLSKEDEAFLSINDLIELNTYIIDIQNLLPGCKFEVVEVKKGSIIETIRGPITEICTFAVPLYAASKAIFELRKCDREIKKIEAETKKIEEEARKIRIENDKSENDNRSTEIDHNNDEPSSETKQEETRILLRELSVDIEYYNEYSRNSEVLEKAAELHRRYPIESIFIILEQHLFEKIPYESRFKDSRIPFPLQGNA
uniref:hypothetical protein n=1 Tax=Candidatus Electronema sp. TaxID=2698783 RepID=UPI004056E8D1